MRDIRPVVQTTLVTTALAGGLAALTRVAAGPGSEAWGALAGPPPDPGGSLEAMVSAGAVLAAIVGVGALLLTAIATLAREVAVWALPAAARHLPAIGTAGWRRLVLGACGLAIALPPAAAHADEDASATACGRSCAAAPDGPSLSGLPLPELPVARRPAAARPRDHVTVAPGDSLWLIAERLLPASAPDVAVARLSLALYADNRAAIGADPDLILSGTRLTIPGGSHVRGR